MRPALGRGPTYYRLAASYRRALARRETAASEVLGKLASGFPRYVAILNHLRSEYFNLVERLGARDLEAIHSGIDREAHRAAQTARVDVLLDLYSCWLRSGDRALLEPMRRQVAAIRAADPGFEFELPHPG